MKLIKSLTVVSFIFASVATLAACNTVEGVGKDVSQGGQAIQRSAN